MVTIYKDSDDAQSTTTIVYATCYLQYTTLEGPCYLLKCSTPSTVESGYKTLLFLVKTTLNARPFLASNANR